MGDVNLEIKLSNLDERVIKIEESGGGSGGDGYITSVSNDFTVVNKKLSLSNDVTTKLSKVDTTDNLSVELAKKIDKPASATNGQVLTYNGTSNEWEAQDSKGGADDTSIISDAYDESKSYVAGEYCIYNNLLWKCLVQHNGQTPTEGTYWTNVSVANEIASVNSSLKDLDIPIIKTFPCKLPAYQQTTDKTSSRVLINGSYSYPQGFTRDNCTVISVRVVPKGYSIDEQGRHEAMLETGFILFSDSIRAYVGNQYHADSDGYITLLKTNIS